MKKIAAVLAAGMTVAALAGCGMVEKTDSAKAKDAAKIAQTVIAQGTGFTVTQGEIDEKYKALLKQIQEQYGDERLRSDQVKNYLSTQKNAIMEQLLRQKIYDIKVNELKITKDKESIQTRLKELLENYKTTFGSQEKFEAAVKAAGFTMESYTAELTKNLQYEELVNGVIKDVKVEDKEIQDYYDKNKDTLYVKKPGATIYHIWFGKPDDADAEAKAKEAKARLDRGEDFAQIAQQYGKDATAVKGGLLGDYAYDTTELGSDFMAEVKKLKDNEISAPVKTSFGWHIIKVTNVRTENQVQPLADVKASIEKTLLNNKQQEKIAATVKQWETELKVERFADKINQDTIPLPDPLPKTDSSSTPSSQPTSTN